MKIRMLAVVLLLMGLLAGCKGADMQQPDTSDPTSVYTMTDQQPPAPEEENLPIIEEPMPQPEPPEPDKQPAMRGFDEATPAELELSEYLAARYAAVSTGHRSGLYECTVMGIYNDESAHFEMLTEAGFTVISSECSLEWIAEYDAMIYAIVLETQGYYCNGVEETETVEHHITLMFDDENTPIVVSDGYKESFSGFVSASYVEGNNSFPALYTELSEQELAWFNEDFFNTAGKDGNLLPNCFLNSFYTEPAQIDLHQLFYNGPIAGYYAELTSDEQMLLETAGVWLELDVVKYTSDEMNAILQTYTGLTLQETNENGMETFAYLEEFDAYYHSHGDTNYQFYTITGGWRKADGTVCLEYGGGYIVTLVPHNDGYCGYRFASNLEG